MIKLLQQNKELYNLYTRKEEYDPIILDKHQRFLRCLSRYNILEPDVSKFFIQNGLKVEYPEGKKFAVCLMHDIDIVNYSKIDVMYKIYKSLRQMQFKHALLPPFYRLNKTLNPLWNFEKTMVMEEKYGAKSSFYFMALDKNSDDCNYNIDDLKLELRSIIEKGFEVGLHGGYYSYNNLNEIRNEKNRLEKVLGKRVIGYRNHVLRFKVPDTWKLLRKAGFKYDSTLGYADCVGFRNGMCHPFKPFNLNTNSEIDILEIPLNIMDVTLFDYMKLDLNGAWKITKLLIDIVEKYNGIITILWHNTYMDDTYMKFYEKILKYCHDKNAWMPSGNDIFRWIENGSF